MRQLHESLWVHEDAMKMGVVELPLRMTIVLLGDGGLWVHSPTRFSEALAGELAQLGAVAVLVAPNNVHNRFLMDWVRACPQAEVHVARGIPGKLPDLGGAHLLDNASGCPWPEDLEMQVLDGAPFFDECVFLHPASRSLIVTDFVQNHRNQTHTGMARVMTKLLLEPIGFKDICLAPPLRFPLVIRDREAHVAALKVVLGWTFDRIIVTHGEIIDQQARETFARLCARFRVS